MQPTPLPAAVAALACLLAGCGAGDGLSRYPVKGTVTYQGQPVKDGAIFFEPTASVGKLAPTVYLRVSNGKYEVLQNEGPVAGKYQVVVGGRDESSKTVDRDGITQTKQLFEDY